MSVVCKILLCICCISVLASCMSPEKGDFLRSGVSAEESTSSGQGVSDGLKKAFAYKEEDRMEDIFLINTSEDGVLSLWDIVGKIQIVNSRAEDFEYSYFSLNLEIFQDGEWYVCPRKLFSAFEGLEMFICKAGESTDLHLPSCDWFSLDPGHYRIVLTEPSIPEYTEPDPDQRYYWTSVEFDLTNDLPD